MNRIQPSLRIEYSTEKEDLKSILYTQNLCVTMERDTEGMICRIRDKGSYLQTLNVKKNIF